MLQAAGPTHEKLYQAICAVIRNEASDMPAEEILAIMCNLVGKLIGVQDQRIYTPEVVMELVIKNITAGNEQLVRELTETPGAGGFIN